MSSLTKEERKIAKIAAKKAAKKAAKIADAVADVVIEAAEEKVEDIVDAVIDSAFDNSGAHIVTTKQNYSDRIIAVPEKVKTEIKDEAFISVPRRVIEQEKVIKVKEVVEVTEIEYVDEYITEEYIQDVHRQIEKPITIEREVERIIHVDEVETLHVEVPDVTYDDVVVVKDVLVPHRVEKEVYIEKIVPQIREEIIEDVNYIYHDRQVQRNIPVPVEATVTQQFAAPRVESVHKEKDYKILLPEFREHAVWDAALTDEGRSFLPDFQARINDLAGSSLCEVEKLFCDFKASDLVCDDWLDTKEFRSTDGLRFLGVESLVINKPQFQAAPAIISRAVSYDVDHDGKTKKKSQICGLGGDDTSQKMSGIVVPDNSHDRARETYAMVENANEGLTMVASGVRYARKGDHHVPTAQTARDTRSAHVTASRISSKNELRSSRSLATAVSY